MLLICFILGHIPACWHNLNKVVLSPPGKIKPSRLLSDSLVLTSIKSIAKPSFFAAARHANLSGARIATRLHGDGNDAHHPRSDLVKGAYRLYHVALACRTRDVERVDTLCLMHARFFGDAGVAKDGRDVPCYAKASQGKPLVLRSLGRSRILLRISARGRSALGGLFCFCEESHITFSL